MGNENISLLDVPQLARRVIDGTHDAVRVVNAFDTEMAIEVSAEEGDSVEAVARHRLIQESHGEVSCGDLREICMFGAGSVELSPDGQEWHSLSIQPLEPKSICAAKLRVKNCKVVGRS